MITHSTMVRTEDESGVSGVGEVADVVEFENGMVAIGFRKGTASGGTVKSLAIYGSRKEALKIHGHDGRTSFRYPMSHPDSYEQRPIGELAKNDISG